jgi:hypothetical protein
MLQPLKKEVFLRIDKQSSKLIFIGAYNHQGNYLNSQGNRFHSLAYFTTN